MPVTYHDLPTEIDPVAFLFGDERITVPESRFTPPLIAQFYERSLRSFDVTALHSKSDHVPHGLESLPSLLRYEPGQSGNKWIKLMAPKESIESALPSSTPYQLQYLVLFSFQIPKWNELPTVETGTSWIVNEFTSTALLFGKNQQLYLVTATWRPEYRYFHSRSNKEPSCENDPYVFNLGRLTVESIKWNDERVMKKIADGEWADIGAFRGNLYRVLSCTADVLERRARNVRRSADLLGHDGMSIYTGR